MRLSSFGVVSVSLHDMNGKRPNIAEGKSATIRLPIDGALAPVASPTIKLRSFDESKCGLDRGGRRDQGRQRLCGQGHPFLGPQHGSGFDRRRLRDDSR